ncbi:MAG: hypothetical protein WDA09_06180, partial [Bacteriovoracaceae bacterium]
MKEDISLLLNREESPILEFKRQWYWDDSTPNEEMADKWGELLKDIISLANGYLNCTGEHRYLIVGFSEKENALYNVEFDKIKQLKNLGDFKKNLLQKLEGCTKPALIGVNISPVTIESNALLVFEIPCPTYLIELKRELKTKTRHLDEGAVLIRKGQKKDEVRTATPDEIENLKIELVKYKDSELHKRLNPELDLSTSERSIEKTVQLFIDKNASFTLADNFPVKERNWKDNIVYEVYRLEDGFSGLREFVYIHDSSNQGKTLADIKKKNLIRNLSVSIVLIDRPKIKDVERRKYNIKKLFESEYVYFIDEFGYERLYKDCILPFEKFNLPVYVNSLYDEEKDFDLSAIERLKSWFHSDDEPLFVVSGHGGIGKTTLA